MKKAVLLSVFTVALLAFALSASTLTEVGDVGQLTTAAGTVPGGTLVITGTVSLDADLWKFYWGGGAFYANSTGSNFDSQLFLFDSGGVGVQGNDDGIAFAGPAYLQLASLASGFYYIGVSGYNLDPYDTDGNLMFNSFPFEDLYGPNTSEPLGSWAGGGQTGTYYINFRQITDDGTVIGDNPTGAPVPEPGTMLLLGTGLVGLARAARKRFAA